MSSRNLSATVIVPINSFSDGDLTCWPTADPAFRPCDEENYLRKVATKWKEEMDGIVRAGKVYKLDKLPAGYALYERPRRVEKAHVDKYLFGHPSGRGFDSPFKFFPHFLSLMNDASSTACPCELCPSGRENRHRGRLPNSARTDVVTNVVLRTPMTRLRKIEGRKIEGRKIEGRKIEGRKIKGRKIEGHEESQLPYFTSLLESLRKQGSFTSPWQENRNIDWRATRKIAAEGLRRIFSQPAFIPRVGELVLWCDATTIEIRQDPQSKEFRIYDSSSGEFGEHPRWLGGVITQGPVEDEPVGLGDLLTPKMKKMAVTYTGFRVECLPDPNHHDKTMSLQYRYVYMHHIRPLAFWKEILLGIPSTVWHPSIRNCMTVMGTIAQLERYNFDGIWPDAQVKSEGFAYGAEEIFVGDVVRLFDEDTTTVTDILHVTDLVFHFYDFQSKKHERVKSGDAETIYAKFHGFHYTSDIDRSFNRVRVEPSKKNHGLPAWVHDYGTWYHLRETDRQYGTSCVQFLGRLFEPAAIQKWFPEAGGSSMLNIGFAGVKEAKDNACQWDNRMKNPPKPYWIGETRVQCLDINRFNNQSVDSVEDPKTECIWAQFLGRDDEDSGNTSLLSAVGEMAVERRNARGRAIDEDADVDMEWDEQDQGPNQGVMNYAVQGLTHDIDDEDGLGHASTGHTTPIELIDPRLRVEKAEAEMEIDTDEEGRPSKRLKMDNDGTAA